MSQTRGSGELVAFLGARLDEDEAAAKANIGAGPGWQHGLGDTEGDGPMWPDYQTYDSADLHAAYAYLAHFRPLRMLHEVEAGRRLLRRYQMYASLAGETADQAGTEAMSDALYLTMLDRAAVYSGHPDYRQEWSPDAR